MRGWVSDLALGIRLAVGGGRSSMARFALSTFGIAIAVAVLLVGASVGSMVEENGKREAADVYWLEGQSEPAAGVDPLYISEQSTEFRGERVEINYVYSDGADHPLPPGVDRLPGPGEMLTSPALADLLASSDGQLLRPRLPGPVIGTLGKEVVTEPDDLKAYVGAEPAFVEAGEAQAVYRFTEVPTGTGMPPQLLLLVLIGAVVLLLPVFIFVSSASRIAGAERDRRLSALRLVGAGSRQVRRIAAAESLVSALAGLVLGSAAFLYLRTFAEDVEFFGMRVYQSDVVPSPVLVGLIVLAIPALAVLTALFALRRTIIEPLGVVRRTKPVRRRAWWRFAMVAVGVVLLFTGGGGDEGSDTWAVAVSVGTTLLLVGVPVLLPWLVERVSGRIHGGPSSWQLAIRRLQLDSGTSARVVGGIAVVLAGAIALQTMLMTLESDVGLANAPEEQPEPTIEVRAEESVADEVTDEVIAVPSVLATHQVRGTSVYVPGQSAEAAGYPYLHVMDCAALLAFSGVEDCTDGDVFRFAGMGDQVRPGQRLEFREYLDPNAPEGDYDVVGDWTVPETVREVPTERADYAYGGTIATPGAVEGVTLPEMRTVIRVEADPNSDELEQLRNAVAGFGWRASMFSYNTAEDRTADQQMFVTIRNGLYAGAIFTLLLAGVSLLVLALEQIRERRRPLAMLVASGVQRAVIARSLLWQVALPIALGVLVAVLTGVGLAWLVVRITDEPFSIDWLGVGLLSAGAALLSILVTAMTLPFLRSATRLTSLRTE
ncbi:FtsX-like permease family protein [Actinophytocola gossypii]|uniref:ABC transporter permease n=1 Tax=Actinophytocola gossypii TaxID=2812003 RepID=A0ABT2JCX4_9PSEU|nr:FtsX-like permease family protein [Actinophytocola gossypii]MCT2585722.1 ABC transporter permease [Actinophytocola gossypii]